MAILDFNNNRLTVMTDTYVRRRKKAITSEAVPLYDEVDNDSNDDDETERKVTHDQVRQYTSS